MLAMWKNLRLKTVHALVAVAYFGIAKYLNTLACSSTKRSPPLICSLHDLDRVPVIHSLVCEGFLSVDLSIAPHHHFAHHITFRSDNIGDATNFPLLRQTWNFANRHLALTIYQQVSVSQLDHHCSGWSVDYGLHLLWRCNQGLRHKL